MAFPKSVWSRFDYDFFDEIGRHCLNVSEAFFTLRVLFSTRKIEKNSPNRSNINRIYLFEFSRSPSFTYRFVRSSVYSSRASTTLVPPLVFRRIVSAFLLPYFRPHQLPPSLYCVERFRSVVKCLTTISLLSENEHKPMARYEIVFYIRYITQTPRCLRVNAARVDEILYRIIPRNRRANDYGCPCKRPGNINYIIDFDEPSDFPTREHTNRILLDRPPINVVNTLFTRPCTPLRYNSHARPV